jgi:hypothetical protein
MRFEVEMRRDQQYEDTKRAVAELIARERGEVLSISHYNEATGVLWPILASETQSRLILR